MPPEPSHDSEPAPKPVLVSACLLGHRCRYDGRENEDLPLRRALEERGEIPHAFCPEEAGGLATPREPASLTASAAEAWRGHGEVRTEAGEDVTGAFKEGARLALETCQRLGIQRAYLKERSPSCGVAQTHVQGELVEGPGLTSERLASAGIETLGVPGRRP